ncbi:hypothetical protein Ndes2526B_g03809 [Nannochloris sp. 'desiccata']|nr:putative Protein NEOXANTHIN-DEFICIENT 1 [Chlorella desiccata (nom. nud.)]
MGYGKAPWNFKGQALYQLSLVKIEEARKFVPPELPLVNFFGWTLGGFYLARYTDSPVGSFEELVALAGLVWDFPTSCAWAARVYVNNKEARDHGISSVGLPSRLAGFKAIKLHQLNRGGGGNNGNMFKSGKTSKRSWWDVAAPGRTENENANSTVSTVAMELSNLEPRGRGRRGLHTPVCHLDMPHVPNTWAPRIQMFLPSFSGATLEYPGLLKYSLKLMTHVRFLKPVSLRLPDERHEDDHSSGEVLDAVLGGKPLLCMAFDNMEMVVQPPEPWTPLKGKEVSIERMQGKAV